MTQIDKGQKRRSGSIDKGGDPPKGRKRPEPSPPPPAVVEPEKRISLRLKGNPLETPEEMRPGAEARTTEFPAREPTVHPPHPATPWTLRVSLSDQAYEAVNEAGDPVGVQYKRMTVNCDVIDTSHPTILKYWVGNKETGINWARVASYEATQNEDQPQDRTGPRPAS